MNVPVKYSDSFLNQARTVGDDPADQFIRQAFNNASQKSALQPWLAEIKTNQLLNKSEAEFTSYPFIAEACSLPSWAEKKKMQEGAAFFARNIQLILNMLGLLSLPYCYAAADGANVLSLSQRMNSDVGKRLFETAEFLWDVMAPNAFDADGSGFASILKVRIMHAAARYYVQKNSNWNPGWGYPVNQEDMAGTNLSFSLIVIRGLRNFGVTVSYTEQQSYMHLWNVIGYKLGLDESLLPDDSKKSFQLEEAIRVRHFRESSHGKQLTESLVNYFMSVNDKKKFTNNEIVQLMRYLLGNHVADIVGLPLSGSRFSKLKLLQVINFFNAFRIVENEKLIYDSEFFKFIKNKPVI